MAAVDFAYRNAAKLAEYLTDERPGADDSLAVDVAWEILKKDDPATFQAGHYRSDVLHVLKEIRAGRLNSAVSASPAIKQRALARFDQYLAELSRS